MMDGQLMMLSGAVMFIVGIALQLSAIHDGYLANQPGALARVSGGDNEMQIIDVDGRFIVPEGVDTWGNDWQSFQLWDQVCNRNKSYAWLRERYEWFIKDRAGAPLSKDEQDLIWGHYAEPHVPYRQQYGYEE